MTQHNSFSLFFQPSHIVGNLHVHILSVLFLCICLSCSSFIPIRNLKLYTNIIATPIDAHDKVEIIHYVYIYITVLNTLAFGRCSPVSIHSSSDRFITAPNDPNIIHLLLGFHISAFVVIICYLSTIISQ